MKRPRFVVIHDTSIVAPDDAWVVLDTTKKYKQTIGFYAHKEDAENAVRKLNRRSHHSEETR